MTFHPPEEPLTLQHTESKDSISGLCKRHWIAGWLAPVKVPKLCRVWTQGVITQPLTG
ncbi:hypothetical protein DEO72_LG2g3223 [Vigna unguiculata]|uniref:Uncharacterized protein n=1 Tax=Vigna unguiculata TaxID=3917 RepID=A0A4D6L2Z2_VIGUN|nr:hypothetical protein DEO72_LG2g3223 [Vigna unguiculata]